MILWRGIAQGEFRHSPAVDFPELIISGVKSAAMSILLLGPAAREADPAYREAHVNFILDALRMPTGPRVSTARESTTPTGDTRA
jgi:hypothetical protein